MPKSPPRRKARTNDPRYSKSGKAYSVSVIRVPIRCSVEQGLLNERRVEEGEKDSMPAGTGRQSRWPPNDQFRNFRFAASRQRESLARNASSRCFILTSNAAPPSGVNRELRTPSNESYENNYSLSLRPSVGARKLRTMKGKAAVFARLLFAVLQERWLDKVVSD